jgi:D-arginine dehydrogenase
MLDCRFLVVGAGIAGASTAAELAAHGPVILIEREDRPGYHTTGRSAAHYTETYGPDVVRALTRASRGFYYDPPAGISDAPLLTPRGSLTAAAPGAEAELEGLYKLFGAELGDVRLIDRAEVRRLVPVMREEAVIAAIHEPSSKDMDVAAIHQGYLRRLKADGGTLLTSAELLGLDRRGGRWIARTAQGEIAADVVVNAGGAWVDQVAALAGAEPVGIIPKRRTAVIFEPRDPAMVDKSWPFYSDLRETYYFRPEAGHVFCSPTDATPSEPCDAQPEDLDVAIVLDRIETATTLEPRRIIAKWAGLRCFAPDGDPVFGWDDAVAGFFWYAGQGGYGIQMAPAAARLAAALIAGAELPPDLADRGIVPESLSPSRLRSVR